MEAAAAKGYVEEEVVVVRAQKAQFYFSYKEEVCSNKLRQLHSPHFPIKATNQKQSTTMPSYTANNAANVIAIFYLLAFYIPPARQHHRHPLTNVIILEKEDGKRIKWEAAELYGVNTLKKGIKSERKRLSSEKKVYNYLLLLRPGVVWHSACIHFTSKA